MRRALSLSSLVSSTLLVFAFAGCATDTTPSGDTGSLSLQLVLGDGIVINEVKWTISGGEPPMEMSGTIDTSAPGATASVEVFGLPPTVGPDYTIEMEAEAEDGTACTGSENFGVDIGEVTEIMVFLNCKRPQRLGAVRVNGKFNICPELVKATVSPLQTSVGNEIDLSAEGVDADDDDVFYEWSGTGGSIDDPDAEETTYTCQEVGDHLIRIDVTDGDDVCDPSSWTVPVTCVPGEVECIEDADCDEDEVCENNQCVPDVECNEDADCDAGEVCENNQCVPDVECNEDADCDAGEVCENNECVPDVECNEDADCDAGEVCENNECVPDVECNDDMDCGVDEVCQGNVCVSDPRVFCDTGICAQDTQARADCIEAFLVCIAEEPANEEECIALSLLLCNECNENSDCDAGEICDNNVCVPDVECNDDSDCDVGEMCVENECVECTTGADCADGMECTADVCTALGTCSNPPQEENVMCSEGGGNVCDGSGNCVECNNALQCPGGGECQVPSCDANACDLNDAPDGTPCLDNTGECMNGVCEMLSDPIVGAGSGTTDWQALPTTATGCTYDSVDTICTGCTITGPSVPGGGQCGAFGTQVVGGCEVPGGVLNAQLAVDTTISIEVSSTGDGNVTTDVTVTAENPALGTAAGLVSVDATTIFTSVATGVPTQLENNLNSAFSGQLLGFFTGGTNVLLLDSDEATGLGVEIPISTTPVTPTSSPSVAFDYDTFSLTLTIVASGTPLIVDDAGCIFDLPGDPVTLPVE